MRERVAAEQLPLARELTGRRHAISHEKVAQYLRGLGYSLQGNRKTEEGADHPDRDAQFRHINISDIGDSLQKVLDV